MLIKTKITTSRLLEGTKFELTAGTDDLCESPGRIGLWICNEHGSSVKVYFDQPESLDLLAFLLKTMSNILVQVKQP